MHFDNVHLGQPWHVHQLRIALGDRGQRTLVAVNHD
jgi:hypothetical protein